MKYITMALAILVACSSGNGGNNDATVDTTPPARTLTVTTYNAGLAMGYVDYGPEREPLIGPAVALLDADVICLQEVWNQTSIDRVIEGAKTVFPHNYYEITDAGEIGGEPACTEDGTKELKACVLDKCAGIEPSTLGSCALDFCAVEFGSVQPKDCVNCIASNIGLAEAAATVDDAIDAIIGACLEGAGGGFAYEGRNGLLILSRHPLAGKEFLRFESSLNVRVLLHAVAQVPNFGDVDVFCTHLTAFMTGIPYLGNFESWEKEQAQQIDALLPWITEKEDVLTPTTLLGDMNCGPQKGDDILPSFPANFDKFIEGGLTGPYGDDADAPCTWCANENPLTGGIDRIIDHVFFKNVPKSSAFESVRVMDEPVTLTVGGDDIDSRYSDHYGAQVTLTLP
ncbi:MAG: endonuclease/exonuclease/phosphatase family protein [Deltaproteobacteria bacterium]|nr:endonuclease/exonuclease/phosphatase family protein [Deltaproteobacteria bacterium]